MKQVIKWVMIFTLSVAVTHCSRDETKPTMNDDKGDGGSISKPKVNYILSPDKKTLIQWLNKETKDIDMQKDPELQNVTVINKKAFEGISLTNIVLPNNLKTIGDEAFYQNNLTTVNIPNGVTSIGNSAFNSNQLTNVTIPNSVTAIGELAFYSNQLTDVTIPNGVITIGKSAFEGNQLNKLTISDNVTTIGELAFSNNQLTNVTIPSSVTTIGRRAFYYNDNLSIITIRATTPPNVSEPFGNSNSISKIHVPQNSVNTYKMAQGWSQYADKIFPIQ